MKDEARAAEMASWDGGGGAAPTLMTGLDEEVIDEDDALEGLDDWETPTTTDPEPAAPSSPSAPSAPPAPAPSSSLWPPPFGSELILMKPAASSDDLSGASLVLDAPST